LGYPATYTTTHLAHRLSSEFLVRLTAAWLLSIAQPGEIIMNERFATRVFADHKMAPVRDDIPTLRRPPPKKPQKAHRRS